MGAAQSVSVPARIPSQAIGSLCEVYDESLESFERILWLENRLYPLILERSERDRGQQGDGGGGGSPWGEED
jgi:hypothetical protein